MKGKMTPRPEYNMEREKSVEYYGWSTEGGKRGRGDLGAEK